MSILVIDAGTSSIRGTLYSKNAQKLGTYQIKYSPKAESDGRVTQPASSWENSLMEIAKRMSDISSEKADRVEAITLTAARSSIIPLDADGIALSDAIMWQDTRNQKLCKSIARHNSLIFKKSGARVNSVFSGGKIAWIYQSEPKLAEKAAHFVVVADYLVFLMTGKFLTDETYGSRSNMMSLADGKWDSELLDLFGVPEKKLCEILPPGSILAQTSNSFAEITNLPSGIPVISAGGDQQCASLGLGVFEPGTVSITAGTGAFIQMLCDQIPENLTEDLIINAASIPGKYVIETNVLTCTSAFEWFNREIRGMNPIDYDSINKELEKVVPVKTECMCIPYFQGRGTPDWNSSARASFFNISLSTTAAELTKAVLEGISIEIRNSIERLGRYSQLESVRLTGGLSKSKPFDQLLTDVIGIDLVCPTDCESTTEGALITALVTLGICSNHQAAYELINKDRKPSVYTPDPEMHNYYTRRQQKMNECYARQCLSSDLQAPAKEN